MTTTVKPNVTIEDFAKLDLRLGTVKEAKKVEGADKLLQLQVSFGAFERQILAGIALSMQPQDLVGKQFLFLVNLPPKTMKGVESTGMILATGSSDNLGLFGAVENKHTSAKLDHGAFADGSFLS
jgi:methionyl-tRNA synthetase